MHRIRRFFITFLSFICALAISLFLWMATFQATILQPTVVKQWLRNSGIYSNILALGAQQSAAETSDQTLVTPAIVNQALQKTFSPAYVQEQAEQAIDSTYGWLEGQRPLSFSVPINEKQSTFIEQLATTLEPQLVALPLCTNAADAQALRCRLPGVSNQQFAQQIAQAAVTQTNFLQSPLTEQTVIGSSQNSPINRRLLAQLPTYTQLVHILYALLPLLAVVAAVLIWPLATDRLVTYKRLGRRICLGSLLTLSLALLLIYGSTVVVETLLPMNPIANLLLPTIQKAVGAIGLQLALVSGLVVTLSAVLWIFCLVLQRKRQQPPQPSLPTPISAR